MPADYFPQGMRIPGFDSRKLHSNFNKLIGFEKSCISSKPCISEALSGATVKNVPKALKLYWSKVNKLFNSMFEDDNSTSNNDCISLTNSYADMESKVCKFLNEEAHHSLSLNRSLNCNQSVQIWDNPRNLKVAPI